MKETPIVVSILCLTYNHEKYIRRALDGFVSQKTDFAYEVLIHDDCSTDGTADIIREYEQKYPDLIKPIYQTENQYSQGRAITATFQIPRAKGEFFAWCEGDDFWTDEHKLQRQVDFLRGNPEYAACVHKTIYHNMKDGTDRPVPAIDAPRDYSLEEIVMEGGAIFATSSLMFRGETYRRMPDCFTAKGFGDYQKYMYAAISGKIHCMEQPMSVYNECVSGSWTDRVWSNPEKRQRHIDTCMKMLERVDRHYEGKYHRIFERKKRDMEYSIHKLNGDTAAMKRLEYREFYQKDRIAERKVALAKAFPFLLDIKRALRRMLNK